MPGRVEMNSQKQQQQGGSGAQSLKKDGNLSQNGAVQQHVSAPVNRQSSPAGASSTYLAGPSSHAANGIHTNGGPATKLSETTDGNDAGTVSLPTIGGPPPPLDQSWRESDGNKSLGKMLERAAQHTYSDLNDCIAKMAETPVQQQAQQSNGVAQQAEDTDGLSLDKKRMLLEFANSQRERYIKSLVISDWARNADSMARLIDVKVHQQTERWHEETSTRALGFMKRDMKDAKMPNPNIEGAMELLGTGKTSTVPDLGYIPPKRLTAKEMLKTLRNMNVMLSTRLNLHEELPLNMHEYSIANGRATFTVAGEFEVDLSAADEDPTSPLYFIDLRLLFSPTSNVLDDRLRSFFEAEVNKATASKGLQGCYDFLHNFVLTHKIGVLHTQAQDLLQGKWFGCVRIERMRRSLMVQYWAKKPGPKSWLEIGITSGKPKGRSTRRKATPSIAVRWFRHGMEVQDVELNIELEHLDIEQTISQVIAKHAAWVLSDLSGRLRGLAGTSTTLETKLSISETQPECCNLTMGLPSLRAPLRIWIEPVTGKLAISPPSPATMNTQARLNSDPTIDSAKWLANLVCLSVRAQFSREADLVGWDIVRNLAPQENIKTLLGHDVLQRAVFQPPSKGWGSGWAIAVTVGLQGERWWVLQLQDAAELAVRSAVRLDIEVSNLRKSMSPRESLLHIEKTAVTEVSYTVLSAQMQQSGIKHHIKKVPMLTSTRERGSRSEIPVMFINFSSLMEDRNDRSWKPWAHDVVRLSHHGIEQHRLTDDSYITKTTHEIRLSLEPGRINYLPKHLTKADDRDVAMNGTGGLSLHFRSTFGVPFVEQIRARLVSLERLDHYVADLQKHGCRCNTVSLTRLAFAYSSHPALTAYIAFPNDGSLPATLRFGPLGNNSHQRIRIFLEQDFNGRNSDAASKLAETLSFTLPLLQTFDRLEAKDSRAKRTLIAHARTSLCYSLKYKAPLPQVTLEIRGKWDLEGGKRVAKWGIKQELTKQNAESLPSDLVTALKQLWNSRADDGSWDGLQAGAIANVHGVAQVLEKFDEVVRRFEGPASDVKSEVQNLTTTASTSGQQNGLLGGNSNPATVKPEPDVIMLDD